MATKMFSWISRRKPSKATTEDKGRCSSSSSSSNSSSSSSSSSIESNDKLNVIDHHNFHNSEEVEASQRRDIVKIFVNYEEYGLLAIGTLGYDPSGGAEPEFELFEVRPGALEEVRQQQEERNKKSSKSRGHRPVDNDQIDDKSKELVLASRLAAKKKVFPLEGLTHIPHISAGFLKSSRLVERLLHPLSYLGSRSRRGSSSSLVPRESEESLEKKASLFKELVSKGLGISSGSKGRRYPTSSNKLQITNDVDELGGACSEMPASPSSQTIKLKKKEVEDWKPNRRTMTTMTRLFQFPCASAAHVDDEDDEDDDEKDEDNKNDEDDRRGGGGGDKLSKQCCQVDLEQSRTEDDEKEYKIRTESEYVVLEL